MEKISVITPSYNSEKFIKECVFSVIDQEYKNLEHIIIDDCSSDNSVRVIERLAKEFSHIRLIKNPINSGPAKSRNNGLKIAKGNLICFLDSDDVWSKDKLKEQLKFAILNKYPIICGGYIKFGEGLNSFSVIHNNLNEISFNKMKYSNWIYTSSVMVDKRLTGDFKMNPDLYYDDYGCWLVLIKKFGSAYYIPKTILRYRITKNSVSRNKINSAMKTIEVYNKVFNFNMLQKIYYFTFYFINGIKKSI